MPRTYKRKTEDKYTQDDLQQALLDIRENNLSVKTAADHYHIPVRTIFHKLSGSRTDVGRGTKTILTKEEESYLVHTILLFQEWQRPMSPCIIIGLARSYMLQLGKKISEQSTLRDWFSGFMQRWSNEIKLAKTVKLEKARSEACRKETIDSWFKHLHEVLTKYNLFDRPEALWNADESGFCEDPGRRSVVVKRDSKYAISCQSGTGKSFTTVLVCSSASGEKLPPYIIYRGIKLWSTWIPKNGFPGTRYNVTPSGWVEEEVFYDWFVNQFCPAVQHIKRPLILFFDGHRAHISARIVKTAMDNGIQLECLPPHTTTILQPLDVVTLNKVKTAWRTILIEHNTKTNSAPIGKQKFSLMISDLWQNYIFKGHCSAGFAKAGIYPYDPRAVCKEKLLGPSPSIPSNNEIDIIDEPMVLEDSSIVGIPSSSPNQFSSTDVAHNTTSTQTDLDQSNSTESSPQMITTTSAHIGNIDISSTISPITTVSSLSLTVDATTTPSQHSAPNDYTDSNSNVPVFTDLTDQRVKFINNSFSASQAPINVLANVISHYMTTSAPMPSNNQRRKMIDRNKGQSLTCVEVLTQLEQKEKAKQQKARPPAKKTPANGVTKKRGRPTKLTQQQQMLDGIEQLSQIDQWNNPDLQSASTAVNQNLAVNQYTNSYPYIPSDPSHHASFYHIQQPSQINSSCYRCNTIIYGNFTNCISCGRSCCQLCVQLHFFSNPITCEYCAMHTALAQTQDF